MSLKLTAAPCCHIRDARKDALSIILISLQEISGKFLGIQASVDVSNESQCSQGKPHK